MGGGRHGHQTGVADWVMAGLLSFMQFNFARLAIGLQSGVEIFRLEVCINSSWQPDLKLNFDA